MKDLENCRNAFERWCLSKGYSKEGHPEADGRWEGYQAAYNQPLLDELGKALENWQTARTAACNEGGITNLGRLANAEHGLVRALARYNDMRKS